MTKVALLTLGLATSLFYPVAVRAQDMSASPDTNSPAATPPPASAPVATTMAAPSTDGSASDAAVREAVLKQANAIVLRNKLADARATAQRGNTVGAAKIYQECVSLSDSIGPGVPDLTREAIAGLTETSMVLARDAQSRGDYREADKRVSVVLKANPQDAAAIAFKAQNDQLIAAQVGKVPDVATMERATEVVHDKVNADTLTQDGKVLYEMGKLDEAQQKLDQAVKLDPDNTGALYYMNLIQQAKYQREMEQHTIDTQTRMAQVEKQWVLPKSSASLPVPNPYATNSLTYTGPGRQAIIAKLDNIRLDHINFDGLPLNEVLRQLSEQSKLRDPERKGINFLVNPNADQSGPAVESALGAGLPGAAPVAAAAPAPAAAIDPNTGLPIAGGAAGAAPGGEAVDINTAVSVKLELSDVRLSDVLEAIVLVAEHPPGHQLKYSVQDFGVVFSDKGPETPQLFTRTFKVDPNTFYSGLESVGSSSFGAVNSSGTGGSTGGGGGGGANGQNGGGAVVGVVNAFAGAGSFRNNGSGGGGGGGGGSGTTAINPLNAGTPGAQGGGGGGAAPGGGGGLNFITQVSLDSQVSAAARAFFTTLGVNLIAPPGKAVFFNDKSGILLVKATEQDLDTIDKAIQVLNTVAPQVHIKARFIEVQQTDSKAMGFDWYLGQFNLGDKVVGTGGSSPSLNVPTSAANPLGAFPGNTAASVIPGSATDQLVTSGLQNSGPAVATITGILTNPNFQVVLHMLQQRSGFETLAEPEIVTTSGRQTQMRATQVITVITGVSFQQGTAATTGTGTAVP